ncbi:MAG: trigger factor [Defluviitaleaceae bacterium]|nr:trigger factor [Defluviitaleaceae bacterium]
MASAKKSKTVGILSSEMKTEENSKVILTITVTPERLREGLAFAYNRSKQYFNIPGFRKGKAPRKMIEQMYGREVFYEDAFNYILPDIYEEALDKYEIEPVYKPEIDMGDIDEKTGVTFIATVFVRPEVEIDEYYGLTYHKGDAEATEEDIQQALRAEQEKNSRQISVSRPAETGDVVTINFKGFMDGSDEPFEGGSGEDHELTLGSGQFIPGFEEQVVGHVPGDDFNVTVTFPENYHHADYSGKDAVFEVEVLDVKANELPEINDEFAEDVSEFDTLAEFRQDLASRIKESKEVNLENEKRDMIMKQLIALAKLEVPEAMYLGRVEDMFNEFARGIEMRGMDMENYMRFTQTSEATLKMAWRKQAEDDINGTLALSAVAKKEAFEVTEEEFKKLACEVMGKEEGDEQILTIIQDMHPSRRKELERSILCQKALDFVMEKATAVDALADEPVNLKEEV